MGRRPWLVALLGGGAAALGHAPFHLWFVALPGFVLMAWAITREGSPRQGFGRAWTAGAVYFAISLHWIVEPFLVDAATHGWMAPGALFLMAGGLALFWGMAGWLALRINGTPVATAIAFAVALTVAELVRGVIFTGFPWAMPAYIWAETPARASVAFIGSYGLTFLTILAASLFAVASTSRASFVAALVLCSIVFGAGFARMNDISAPSELGRVGVVHPSIPQTEKWVRENVPNHINRMLDLTREVSGEADMVVWPEVAVVYPLDVAGPVLERAADAADGVPILTGINRREDGDWFNALVEVQTGGLVGEVYDKVHLVPFGEYIPFKLAFLRAMAATSSNGFSSGDAVRLIDTPLGRALPLVCYEGIFPRHIFKAGDRADYLLLITNDAWFGTFAGPYQHLDQARFRAAEHGLPVVRVANAGVSTVIDRFGRVDITMGLGEIGARAYDVEGGPPTLYSRTGDWPLWVLLALVWAALLVTKRRNAIAKPCSSV
ncbi:MAG: apolipoprotein N-acyltransferase [Paracoccaceae bacterium]